MHKQTEKIKQTLAWSDLLVDVIAAGPAYNSYSFENTIGKQLEPHMQIIYLDERHSGRSERPVDGYYSSLG